MIIVITVRCRCHTLMCRLDALTRCRIRWVCDAHDKAMLR
jgi:hypothetical protein